MSIWWRSLRFKVRYQPHVYKVDHMYNEQVQITGTSSSTPHNVIAWFGIDVLVSVYYSLLWHATTLVSFIYTWSLLPTELFWLLYSDWFTSYLIRALIPYHSHLLLLLNHVVIVVKLCCVDGLMEDRCTSNKHSCQ